MREKRLFVIQEIDENDDVTFEYYCKSRRTRRKLYNYLRIVDNQEHYKSWLDVHELKMNQSSWKKYLRDVNPECEKYWFTDFMVDPNDMRYKYFCTEV